MKRFFSLFALVGVVASAFALASYSKVFQATYGVSKDSNLGRHACQVCHITPKGGAKLNPYGKDVKATLKAAHTKKITEAILRSVENLDSDGDGVKNGAQIRADRLPGGN
jgi:hypothetical protein